MKIAIEKDPLSAYAHSCYALSLIYANIIEEAVAESEYAVKLDPSGLISLQAKTYCLICAGKFDAALEAIDTGFRRA